MPNRIRILDRQGEGPCEVCGFPLYVGDAAYQSASERVCCSKACTAAADRRTAMASGWSAVGHVLQGGRLVEVARDEGRLYTALGWIYGQPLPRGLMLVSTSGAEVSHV